MIVVAAIHGILTGQTAASWPDRFDAWMSRVNPRVHVIKKEYEAGPFPRLNWWKNWRLARSLANELELFWRGGVEVGKALSEKAPYLKTPYPKADIWIVAHSNGAVIALETVKLLAKRGVHVAGVILTGAACGSDVDRTGVNDLVSAGQLGKAIAFSSPDDQVVNCGGLWGWLKWPYGDLGRVGWRRQGEPYADFKIYTLWFAGGHTGYFEPGRLYEMFEMFYRQIREV